MSIRQLPDDVVDKIRSSATVTSLNGVACGLLKNSLDAGANKMNIYIDYGRGNCTVEDNGHGITPGEFAEDGGLCKSHSTSKYPPNLGIHGRRGTFLASVSVLSLMTVTSHHQRYNSHNSISVYHGQVLKRHLPSLPGDRLESFEHGTRVAVHNLFGSMPVRVKHRATLFSDRVGIDKEWGRLIHDVVALLVAWPSDVSVLLRETKGQRELRLKSSDPMNLASRTSRLLTQASLAEHMGVESWIPVSASAGHIAIKGCISLDPVATRRSQFISLGILPLLNEYGNNVLYEEINRVFSKSSFGVVEEEVSGVRDARNGEMPTKPRKGIDRWPMFYFRISLKDSEAALNTNDALSHRQRDLEGIVSLLKAVSYGFLKTYFFRPQKVDIAPSRSVFSTATRRSKKVLTNKKSSGGGHGKRKAILSTHSKAESSWYNTPFDDWHRSKVGLPILSATRKRIKLDEPKRAESRPEPDRLIGEGGKLLRKPFDLPDIPPETNKTQAVESRESDTHDIIAETVAEERKLLKRKRSENQARPEPSEWLQGILKSWKTPVFELVESSVPRLNDEPQRCRGDANGVVNFAAGSISLRGRVSREALLAAEVISQVDHKFILLKLPWRSVDKENNSPALVMLDQHAADERCRLEDLMAGYFQENATTGGLSVIVESLAQPLRFEVSDREGELLRSYKEHFKNWGVIYNVQSPKIGFTKDADSCGVMVTALPPSILERCRTEPRLVVELMRKEIWKLNDEGFTLSQPQATDNESGVPCTTNFHGCPRGILELLHSRSCRSAIMFNDVLTKEQCEDLVRRLARCALPFQCAHGRPSIVPLVDLGLVHRIGGWEKRGSTREELTAWKKWMND